MDLPGGVEPHLGAMVVRLGARGVRTKLPPDLMATDSQQAAPPVSNANVATFKALHVATLEALTAALASGRISDQECVAYIGKWLDPA